MFTNLQNTFLQSKMLSLLALLLFVTIGSTTAFTAPNSTNISTGGTRSSLQASTSGYHYLGNAQGQGMVQNSMVGPGVSTSNQMFYLKYHLKISGQHNPRASV